MRSMFSILEGSAEVTTVCLGLPVQSLQRLYIDYAGLLFGLMWLV